MNSKYLCHLQSKQHPILKSLQLQLPKSLHFSNNSAGPKDADWAETLESLARDPAGTQAMGQNARAHLLENWQARAAPPHIIAPELVDWVKG